jgi:hypothetical protein
MSVNQNNGWSLDVPAVTPGQGLNPAAYNPTASDVAFHAALITAAGQVVALIANLQVIVGGVFSVTATRNAQNLLGSFQPLVTATEASAAGVTNSYWVGTVINWQTALTLCQNQISAGF